MWKKIRIPFLEKYRVILKEKENMGIKVGYRILFIFFIPHYLSVLSECLIISQ